MTFLRVVNPDGSLEPTWREKEYLKHLEEVCERSGYRAIFDRPLLDQTRGIDYNPRPFNHLDP